MVSVGRFDELQAKRIDSNKSKKLTRLQLRRFESSKVKHGILNLGCVSYTFNDDEAGAELFCCCLFAIAIAVCVEVSR